MRDSNPAPGGITMLEHSDTLKKKHNKKSKPLQARLTIGLRIANLSYEGSNIEVAKTARFSLFIFSFTSIMIILMLAVLLFKIVS